MVIPTSSEVNKICLFIPKIPLSLISGLYLCLATWKPTILAIDPPTYAMKTHDHYNKIQSMDWPYFDPWLLWTPIKVDQQRIRCLLYEFIACSVYSRLESHNGLHRQGLTTRANNTQAQRPLNYPLPQRTIYHPQTSIPRSFSTPRYPPWHHLLNYTYLVSCRLSTPQRTDGSRTTLVPCQGLAMCVINIVQQLQRHYSLGHHPWHLFSVHLTFLCRAVLCKGVGEQIRGHRKLSFEH